MITRLNNCVEILFAHIIRYQYPKFMSFYLTLGGQLTHRWTCIGKLQHLCFRKWFGACCTEFNCNSENAFLIEVFKRAVTSSRRQCAHLFSSSIFSCKTNQIFNIAMTLHECHADTNSRSFDCLFNSFCGPTSKKHQSLRVSVIFPAQRANNAEKASIWWCYREHDLDV